MRGRMQSGERRTYPYGINGTDTEAIDSSWRQLEHDEVASDVSADLEAIGGFGEIRDLLHRVLQDARAAVVVRG